MSIPCLKLWLPQNDCGTGVGDLIQLLSVIPQWQARNPGGRVIVAYKMMSTIPTIYNFPGVEYVECDQPPDNEFINALGTSPGPPRSKWWEYLGLDWNARDKRFYYFPADSEMAKARAWWGRSTRPRIVIQGRGGMWCKRWPHWARVTDLLVRHGADVAILDPTDAPRPIETHRLIPRGDLRDALAKVATSDLFVGFDSGPFYAAIGTGTRAIGLFLLDWGGPEALYYPVSGPRNTAICATPDGLPPLDLCQEIVDILDAPRFDAAGFMQEARALFDRVVCRGEAMWVDEDGTDSWVTFGSHEDEIEEYLKINSGVFVDVGAHLGRWSIRAAMAGAKVVAFEPNPSTRKVLLRNIELNGPLDIEVHGCALANAPFTALMSEHAGGSTLSSCAPELRGDSVPYAVPVKRLDDFDLPRVDLIKIDVEGWENEVLRGAMRTIARHRPRIVIEGHGCFDHYGGERLTAETRSIVQDLRHMYTAEEIVRGPQTYWILSPSARLPH